MTRLAEPPASPTATTATFADLWERLGEVPLDRILLDPPPGTAAERDVIVRLNAAEKRLCELVDGVLVEKPMGQYESRLAALIIHLLYSYLDKNDLGIVLAPDGPMRLAAGSVRLPDVAFVSWTHFPGKQITRDAILDHAPDLAIEVLSKSNTPKEMGRKLLDYFSAGTTLVWYIEPRTRTAVAYTAPDQGQPYGEDDTLDATPVLPGFVLSLRELFVRAGAAPQD
jgi:Uma2 family endonuclease